MASAYPTSSDLLDYLSGAGFSSTLTDGLDLETAAGAGIAAFEREVGRKMLWTGDAELRRFDPPVNVDRILFLPYDLASLTSLVYYPTNGTSETLTVDTDYELEPYNASLDGKPYERIRFLNRRWLQPLGLSNRRALRITGTWAYSASAIPDDAWTAMLHLAALSLWPQLTQYETGGRLSIREGEAEESFGVETWGRLQQAWSNGSAVVRYRRMVRGI